MEDANDSIKIMPEGFNQFDLNFKIIIVGDSGNLILILNQKSFSIRFRIKKIADLIFNFIIFLKQIHLSMKTLS